MRTNYNTAEFDDVREFTHVRRQDDVITYQYNVINPIAQKK